MLFSIVRSLLVLSLYVSFTLVESLTSPGFYRFSWLRRLRLLRRYASQNTLIEHSSSSPACFNQWTSPPSLDLALQRRSAPVKLSRTSENIHTMPVKALAESWYADSIDQHWALSSTDTETDVRPVRLVEIPTFERLIGFHFQIAEQTTINRRNLAECGPTEVSA